MVLADVVSGERFLIHRRCLLTVPARAWQKGPKTLCRVSEKGTKPIRWAPPSCCDHLSWAPLPNTITSGIRILTYEFWGGTHRNVLLLNFSHWPVIIVPEAQQNTRCSSYKSNLPSQTQNQPTWPCLETWRARPPILSPDSRSGHRTDLLPGDVQSRREMQSGKGSRSLLLRALPTAARMVTL